MERVNILIYYLIIWDVFIDLFDKELKTLELKLYKHPENSTWIYILIVLTFSFYYKYILSSTHIVIWILL